MSRHNPRPSFVRALATLLVSATVMGLLVALVVAPPIVMAASAARRSALWFTDLPSQLPVTPLPAHSTMLAADGSVIATFFSEDRVTLRPDQVSSTMRDAIVSIEDTRFDQHGAIDLVGVARAVSSNSSSGSRQGASTITQQYVKNVLLSAASTDAERDAAVEVSLSRKLREARYAVEVERTMSKDEILTGYLNASFFGAGAYGIGAASQRYFSLPVSGLNLPQAAMLAGLVQSPDSYNPIAHPKQALKRRNVVLRRMAETGRITFEQMRVSQATKLDLRPSTRANGCIAGPYPYFCEWVRSALRDDPAFGATPLAREQLLYRGGLTVRTTLDRRAQRDAQRAVDSGLGRDNRVAAGLAVVEPGTGHVLAMSQNRGFGSSKSKRKRQTEINLVTARVVQSGSTFKPYTLAAALEHGWSFDAKIDAPSRFCSGSGSQHHCIHNSAPWDAGRMTASVALARSSNTFYATLAHDVGVRRVADTATRAGLTFSSPVSPADVTITLGTFETSPLDMASGYATLLGHGVACRPVGISAVTGPGRTALPAPDPVCHTAVEPRVADQVVTAMRTVVDGPDPHRTGRSVKLSVDVAAKTGTTEDASAVWLCGGTADFATALWLGDPRGGFAHPLHDIRVNDKEISVARGGTAAGPIWKAAMKPIVRRGPHTRFGPTSPVDAMAVVPDVRGLGDEAAFAMLRDVGLVPALADRQRAGRIALAPDVVYTTSPEPGSTTRPGRTVSVVMSPGSRRNLVAPR